MKLGTVSFWLLALGSAVIFVAVFKIISGWQPKNRRFATMAIIHQVCLQIDYLGKEFPTELDKVLDAATDYQSLNKASLRLMRAHGPILPLVQKASEKQDLIADAWGRAIIFMNLHDSHTNRLNPVLVKPTRPIAIWSTGSNGVNEYGYGDDVIEDY